MVQHPCAARRNGATLVTSNRFEALAETPRQKYAKHIRGAAKHSLGIRRGRPVRDTAGEGSLGIRHGRPVRSTAGEEAAKANRYTQADTMANRSDVEGAVLDEKEEETPT